MVYLVTYDLKSPGRNYNGLYEQIKQLGTAWAHPLESVWFIDTPHSSATEIGNRLRSFMDDNDGLFVVLMTGNYYGFLNKEIWPWLKNRL